MSASLHPNQVLETCESTNDLAKKMGEETAPHGSWIASRVQSAGRGRLGRGWASEEGNLFFSMILRPDTSFQISATPLCVAIVLFDSIQKLKPTPELKIKWPNDLVLMKNGEVRKVAGILCEGVGSSRSSFVVAGIGVNCKTAPETNQPTDSLGISADALRAELIEKLPKLFESEWKAQRAAYEDRALLRKGTSVIWYSLTDPTRTENGTVDSYGEFGELCVLDESGAVRKLYSEEVKVRTSAHFA